MSVSKVCANRSSPLHSSVLDVPPKLTYTFKIPEIHFPLVGQCVQAFHADCVAQLSKAMDSLAPENSVLLARYTSTCEGLSS